MSQTSVHSSSGTLSDLILWIYLSLPLYNNKGFDLGHTLNGLVVFPTFFNLCLNFAIRSSWSEPQSAPSLVFPLAPSLLSFWSYFSTDLQQHIGHLIWGVPHSVSYYFAFSYCSWGSQSKITEVVFHPLLQWTTSCHSFHYRGLECKSTKSRNTWSNRKIGLGM